jgi:hypothetical protein
MIDQTTQDLLLKRRMGISLDRLLVITGALGVAILCALVSTSLKRPEVLIMNTYETRPTLVLPGLVGPRVRRLPKVDGGYV